MHTYLPGDFPLRPRACWLAQRCLAGISWLHRGSSPMDPHHWCCSTSPGSRTVQEVQPDFQSSIGGVSCIPSETGSHPLPCFYIECVPCLESCSYSQPLAAWPCLQMEESTSRQEMPQIIALKLVWLAGNGEVFAGLEPAGQDNQNSTEKNQGLAPAAVNILAHMEE